MGIPYGIWGPQPPERNTILAIVRKLEITGCAVSERGKLCPARLPMAFTVQNPGILSITWFTDEAWLHLCGYAPMNPVKVGVWCGITIQENGGANVVRPDCGHFCVRTDFRRVSRGTGRCRAASKLYPTRWHHMPYVSRVHGAL
ncbi:hypothetical protein PR048_010560 [Dryococelus australis]|uniref:Uncharacterized protein n=1 Tax=Dryococelus australis TaxID=614101 RepID=A0ABQ9I3X7_9NEOP|nr:hypothetical protein PR048_010560 [Dryococelus australis]